MGGRGVMRQPRWGCGFLFGVTQGSVNTRNPGLLEETPLGLKTLKKLENFIFHKVQEKMLVRMGRCPTLMMQGLRPGVSKEV